ARRRAHAAALRLRSNRGRGSADESEWDKNEQATGDRRQATGDRRCASVPTSQRGCSILLSTPSDWQSGCPRTVPDGTWRCNWSGAPPVAALTMKRLAPPKAVMTSSTRLG